PIGEDEHLQRRGQCGGEDREQTQPVWAPLPFLLGGQDVPGDGDGGATVEDTDGEDNEPIPVAGGIEGGGKLGGVPPAEQPAHERDEAVGGMPGSGGVGVGTEGGAQAVAQGLAVAEGSEGGKDGILAGAVGEDGTRDPQGEAAGLGGTQVGEVIAEGTLD